MTKEEILELARQAGFLTNEIKSYAISPYKDEDHDLIEELEVFAKLVAEKEREECAKICEELRDDWFRGLGRYEFMGEGADYCVDAIRARGQE